MFWCVHVFSNDVFIKARPFITSVNNDNLTSK